MREMHDLVAPYLLGTLEESEHDAFEDHLRGCKDCQEELAALEPGLSRLAETNAVPPPPGLRSRVLDSIPDQPAQPVAQPAPSQRPGWWTRMVLPAAAILIMFVGAFILFGNDPIDEILNAPDATPVELTASDAFTGPPPSGATVTFSAANQSAVLEFEGLVGPSGTNVYEAWFIGSDGATPVGTFTPDGDGTIRFKLDGIAEPGLVVAITEEPTGGQPAPTGAPLFTAEL